MEKSSFLEYVSWGKQVGASEVVHIGGFYLG